MGTTLRTPNSGSGVVTLGQRSQSEMNIRLTVVKGGYIGQTFSLSPGEYRLGRGQECRIRVQSDLISRQHCLLKICETGAWLRDLGSRNGTLVNGQRIQEDTFLSNSDQIQVYPFVFEIQCEDLTPLPASLSMTPEILDVSSK